MRRYVQISGLFFALLAIVQFTRLLLQWPVQVGSVNVPLWASAVFAIATASFAVWAFRSASDPAA